ncbi:glycine cleavage system protein GcvH [Candidatus Bathyarchaeota archaeon]|nr:glycine cleavage system protein GcvH [Candidatus Bathyarchaeota archaeon]
MSDEFYQTVEDKFIFKVKKGLLYTEDDVWVKVEGKSARIGVTDFFQRRGGDIVYIVLPKVKVKVEKEEESIQFETIKAVSTIKSPLSGTIESVNDALNDRPELVNEDPYGEGWLIVVTPQKLKENLAKLLTAEKYFELMKVKIKDDLKKTKGV